MSYGTQALQDLSSIEHSCSLPHVMYAIAIAYGGWDAHRRWPYLSRCKLVDFTVFCQCSRYVKYQHNILQVSASLRQVIAILICTIPNLIVNPHDGSAAIVMLSDQLAILAGKAQGFQACGSEDSCTLCRSVPTSASTSLRKWYTSSTAFPGTVQNAADTATVIGDCQ